MVNHSILLKKLQTYGIWGIAKVWGLPITYLAENNFCQLLVSISNQLLVESGRDRSLRGPPLFLIYTNHTAHCSDLFEFHLFTDDRNLLFSNQNLSLLESNIYIPTLNRLVYGFPVINYPLMLPNLTFLSFIPLEIATL